MSELDVRMMRLAVSQARKGRPSPNPHVGALVVRGSRVVARGYHARAGGPHAEVAALDRAGAEARSATLYVTLEPCNHQGRTGPCTKRIIDSGIRRVVIGASDPSGHSRAGVARMKAAGIQVDVGVLRQACNDLVADFAKLMATGMPWVTLKAAVTLDGKLATRSGDSKWITSAAARQQAHRLRATHDAVLVGAGTVLADDPRLTVRHVRGTDPVRVVLDSKLRVAEHAALLQAPGRALLFHTRAAPRARQHRLGALPGVELVATRSSKQGLHLRSVLRWLGAQGIMRLLVEGGATVHGAFLDAALADAAEIFVAPRIVGDVRARSLAEGKGSQRIDSAWHLTSARVRSLGPDVMFRGRLTRE